MSTEKDKNTDLSFAEEFAMCFTSIFKRVAAAEERIKSLTQSSNGQREKIKSLEKKIEELQAEKKSGSVKEIMDSVKRIYEGTYSGLIKYRGNEKGNLVFLVSVEGRIMSYETNGNDFIGNFYESTLDGYRLRPDFECYGFLPSDRVSSEPEHYQKFKYEVTIKKIGRGDGTVFKIVSLKPDILADEEDYEKINWSI